MNEMNDNNNISPEENEKKAPKKLSARNIVAYSLLTVFGAVFIACAFIIGDYIIDVVREKNLHDELGAIGSILEDTALSDPTPIWTRPVPSTNSPDSTESPSDSTVGDSSVSLEDTETSYPDHTTAPADSTTSSVTENSSALPSVEDTTTVSPTDEPELPSVEDTTTSTPNDEPEVPSVEDTTTSTPTDEPEVPSVEDTTTVSPDDEPELPSVEDTTTSSPTDSEEPTTEATTEETTTKVTTTVPPVTTTVPVTTQPIVLPESPPIPEDDGTFSEKFLKIREELFALNAINPDIIGYISIPNLGINYPLLHRPSDSSNTFYLTHNEKGQEQKAGSIYADFRINREPSSNKNMVIYGHNMRSGSMFSPLSKLVINQKLFNETEIIVSTFYGIYTYKVFSAYRTNAYDPYCTMSFSSDSSYVNFLDSIAQKSTYASPFTDFYYYDRIITLSTCTNMTESGRYAVHGLLVSISR